MFWTKPWLMMVKHYKKEKKSYKNTRKKFRLRINRKWCLSTKLLREKSMLMRKLKWRDKANLIKLCNSWRLEKPRGNRKWMRHLTMKNLMHKLKMIMKDLGMIFYRKMFQNQRIRSLEMTSLMNSKLLRSLIVMMRSISEYL